MKSTFIDGLNQVGLESYLNQRQYSALYWPTLFPTKPVNTLDGKTIIGEVGSRIAAFVTSYDSKAPEVSRKTIATQYFDIPKIAIARKKTEKEILEHQVTKALQGTNAVIEDYFNDVDFVYDAVQARMEWLALTALSCTKFTLSTTNNPLGIINETAVDFGMSSNNKKVVAVIWSTANAATMTPITDIKAVVDAASAAGVKLVKMLMNPVSYGYMIGSTQYQNAAKQFLAIENTVLGLQSTEIANKVMAALRLPQIVLIDTSVGVENAAGTVTYANPWDTDHVLFIPFDQMGNMFSGPIAEEIEKPADVIQVKRGNTLVSVKREFNPVSVITKGESNSFPSWPTVDKCYNMYTANASTWA